MGSIEAAPAAAMPVSLAEAKDFLRVGNGDEDALIAGLLRTAAETCETFTGLVLVRREVVETIAASSAWTKLGATPVRAIEELAGLDAEGGASALPASGYAIDIDADGDGWVRLTAPAEARRVRVRYQAGMAEGWNGVPEPLRHGMVRLCAHFYDERSDRGGASPPAAVSALWRPWRRLRIASGRLAVATGWDRPR